VIAGTRHLLDTSALSDLSSPKVDRLLAATAAAHDLVFVTRNESDIQDLPVKVFNPWLNARE
jgi:predicted nucleic acid-binding protein